jgi:hypothetical protein
VEFACDILLPEISVSAFAGCERIQRITIPRSVQVLGESCLAQCRLLGDVIFESNSELLKIEKAAFRSASGLRSIRIPRSVKEMQSNCFAFCTHLVKVTFESNAALELLGDRCFASCLSLGSICIPASVETIGSECFGNCIGLEAVEFEAGSRLRVIESNAFRSCSFLLSIRLPGSITTLGNFCFAHCGRLQSITFDFPSSAQSIGGRIYDGCDLLKAIYIPSSLVAVFAESFENLSRSWPVSDESALDRFLAQRMIPLGKLPGEPSQRQVMCLASSQNGWSEVVFEDPTAKYNEVSTDEEAAVADDEFAAGYWKAWEDLVSCAELVYARDPKPCDVKVALICPRFGGGISTVRQIPDSKI